VSIRGTQQVSLFQAHLVPQPMLAQTFYLRLPSYDHNPIWYFFCLEEAFARRAGQQSSLDDRVFHQMLLHVDEG